MAINSAYLLPLKDSDSWTQSNTELFEISSLQVRLYISILNFQDLEELHAKYKSKLEEAISLQKKCVSGVNHQVCLLVALFVRN